MTHRRGLGRTDVALTLAGVGVLAIGIAVWALAQVSPVGAPGDESEALPPREFGPGTPHAGATLSPPEVANPGDPDPARSGASFSDPDKGPRVHGYLTRSNSEDPLPILRLRLEQDDSIVSSTVSTASGSFAWDRTLDPADGPAQASLRLPRGWSIEVHGAAVERDTFPLDVAEMRGDRPLRIALQRLAPHPLRGVVVDKQSRDALPYFRVQIGDQILESDLEGRFETRDRAHGPVTLQPVGDLGTRPYYPSTLHFHDVRGGPPAPIELAVQAGPTYQLVVSLPPGYRAEHFRARLREVRAAPPDALDGEPPPSVPGTSILEDPVAAYGLAGHEPRSGVVVRDALPPWVRFPPVRDRLVESGPPWWLVLNSVDGLWVGAAHVNRIGGGSPETVSIHLHAFGRLEGLVMNSTGSLIRSARVRATALGEGSETDSAPSFEAAGDHFLIQGMPTGTYRLETRAPRYREDVREVTVVAGEPTLIDVHLERDTIAGDIAGTVIWESGVTRPSTNLELHSIGTPDRVFSPGHQRILEEGRWVRKFTFRDLPEDEYRLVYRSESTWDVDLPSDPLRPPIEGLVVRVYDGVPSAFLYIEAVDADSGDPVPRLEAQRSNSEVVHGGLGFVGLGRHPLDSDLAWWVRAPGYLERRLGIGEFTEVVEDEPFEERTAKVSLDPGWRLRLRILERAGVPAEGVEIEIGGRPVGTTDGRGECECVLDARPVQLRLSRSGEPLATSIPATQGQLPPRGDGDWRTVLLSP